MSTPPFNGLSQATVEQRQRTEGWNELSASASRGLWALLLEVLREPMFLLLLGASGIYLLMGDPAEALLLLGFVCIIIAITVLQERRTEQALAALRDLSSPRALVLRDGAPQRIPGREVVREDILLLVEGDRVPADGIILESHELAIDESLLTGESIAVSKFAASDNDAADNHRVSTGTLVVSGQGVVRVTAIGAHTALGQIGHSLASVEMADSPLQQEMGHLTRQITVIGLALCLLVTGLYVYSRGDWLAALLSGITTAMSLLPQEFPVILIVFLALGARRIARQQVLTRRLNVIETLGQTTVLCVDKTGTLTQNRMEIAALVAGEQRLQINTLDEARQDLPEPYHELMEYAVLASEIDPHDPMEQAFHRFA
ncbi:HAD-IC family P-type ATPase [Paludibacterium denitrificans]|uniref:HAD-IC family P-type ATPase n=1 Tax=Paludibacterium denitrificans TaxID=2675226 RepID=UPI001E63501D|nr:HAD-IC family P-type ATPase [Paludibacterium denitrificans]